MRKLIIASLAILIVANVLPGWAILAAIGVIAWQFGGFIVALVAANRRQLGGY